MKKWFKGRICGEQTWRVDYMYLWNDMFVLLNTFHITILRAVCSYNVYIFVNYCTINGISKSPYMCICTIHDARIYLFKHLLSVLLTIILSPLSETFLIYNRKDNRSSAHPFDGLTQVQSRLLHWKKSTVTFDRFCRYSSVEVRDLRPKSSLESSAYNWKMINKFTIVITRSGWSVTRIRRIYPYEFRSCACSGGSRNFRTGGAV